MLGIFGFPWLIYYVLHNGANQLNDFYQTFDFSPYTGRILDYLNDSNNLLSYLRSIGTGIATLYSGLPHLIHYFIIIGFTVILFTLVLRVVIDLL